MSSFGRSAIWRTLEGVGGEALSFVAFSVLARLLMPEAFGVVALAGSVLLFMQVTLQHGLTEALIQRSEVDASHLRVALTANLLAATVLVLLGAALAWPLGWLLERPDFPFVLCALLPTLFLKALSGPLFAMLRRSMEFRVTTFRALAGIFSGGAVAVVLAFQGAGPWALVGQQWAVEVVGLLCLSFGGTHKPWQLGKSLPALKELLPMALPVMGAQLLNNAARRFDTLALGFFLADRELGIYFMVCRLVFAVQQVTQNGLADVNMAVLSRLSARSEAFRDRVRQLFRVHVFACCVAFGALAVAAPWLVPLLFGPSWDAAGKPLQILVLLSLGGAITSFACTGLLAAGHAKAFGRLSVAAAMLQLFAVILAARYGLVATVLAAGTAQVVAAIPAVALLCRETGVSGRALFRDAVVPLGVLGGAVGAALAVDASGSEWAHLWAACVFAVTLAAAGGLLLRRELSGVLAARFGAASRAANQ